MESLFAGNIPILYFIAVIYILLMDKLKVSQKILIVYIFSYIIKVYNVLDVKIMVLILNIDMFIYLEYLTEDKLKTEILSNFIYKLIDYFYKMIFEYSFIYFLLALFVKTSYFENCYDLTFSQLNMLQYNNLFCSCLSIILMIITITFLSAELYSTNSFKDMKDKLDSVTTWTTLKISDEDREKFYMLSNIEDKSYFIRDKSYSFVSFGFIKYKINNLKDVIQNINNKEKNKVFSKLRKFFIYLFRKISQLKNIRRYIRGYSTIEMQLIRTLGVKKGYKHIFYRKIYEIIYSKLFFESYRIYCITNKYRVNCAYKEFLMYCYIHLAKIKINGEEYENMLKLWKKELRQVTNEQFLISILGLSWRRIDMSIIDNYSNTIQVFNLDEKKMKKLIKAIQSK